ncbi:sterol desaturase family protein, partial [Acinetobacter baumannii]
GRRIIDTLPLGLAVSAYGWVWEHRLFTVPLDTWWTILLLFLGQEFCYYWMHRADHEIRWFWVNHSVHHSPDRINFSTAFRLG